MLAVGLCIGSTAAYAQQDDDKITFTGSIQSDILIPEDDKKIGTEETSDWGLTNTYVDLKAQSKYAEAGLRFEYLEHPLPGFEKDFKGWGVPHFYVTARNNKNFEATFGTFYEQFGSGFILRTYEERALGIDNSLLGARAVYRPFKGVQIKALSGRQRRFWNFNESWVSGADIEIGLEEWFKSLQQKNIYLTLGASFVNKHEDKEDIFVDKLHKLNVPNNVNAFDVRARLQKGGLNILAEYAQKTQDPSYDNGYIYRQGNVAMLSTSYSKKGFSILAQAKRSDNMSFRSRRSMNLTSSFINHLPAFTLDHTYALAALYPYATQPDGEWAYQGELSYKFKPHTLIGGRYGMKVKVNYSYVNAIQKDIKDGGGMATDGYSSSFFKWGDEMYYQDLNIQIEKKFSKSFVLNLMAMNQFYNKSVVEGEGGMIHSNIFVADGKYKFNNKFTLRGEAQYLKTDDDQGDWAYGLLELSVLPNWMFTLSDMYNVGETDIHYYQGYVTFNTGAHRLQLGYGRTRAGYNCSGGVCRYVPASKGVTLSYNYNF